MEPLASRRVTVAGPKVRLDISLPPQATVAELVPQLLRLSGAAGNANGSGGDVSGWTLARVDGKPIDEAATVSGAGILDGEVLYLHPAGAKPLPLLFDDVPAAVAHRVAGPGRWTPAYSRRAGLATVLIAGVAAAFAIARGWPGPGAAPLAAGIAVTLLLLATVVGRGVGDRTAGAFCAAAGLPLVMLAALRLGETIGPATTLMAAGAAAAFYALAAGVLVPGNSAWPPGVTLAAAVGLAASLASLALGMSTRSVAAIVVAVATLLAPLLPAIALRLSGVPAPRPPGDPASLRSASDDAQACATVEEIGEGADAAGRSLAGLLGGLVAVVAVGVAVLMRSNVDDYWAVGLSVAGGLALVLRSRAYVRAAQKLVLLGGGVAVLGLAGWWLTVGGGGLARLAVLGAVLAAGIGGLMYAARDQEVPVTPYLTRLVDIAEFAVLISLVPLAFAATDLYLLARSAVI